MTIRPSGRMSGPSGWPRPLGQRLDRSPHARPPRWRHRRRGVRRRGASGTARRHSRRGRPCSSSGRPVFGPGGDVDDLLGAGREAQADQPGVHRLDVVDVQAQVARAVVARPRRGGQPLDADVLEQLDEAAAGDAQVDRPDVVELEAQHRRQVRARRGSGRTPAPGPARRGRSTSARSMSLTVIPPWKNPVTAGHRRPPQASGGAVGRPRRDGVASDVVPVELDAEPGAVRAACSARRRSASTCPSGARRTGRAPRRSTRRTCGRARWPAGATRSAAPRGGRARPRRRRRDRPPCARSSGRRPTRRRSWRRRWRRRR